MYNNDITEISYEINADPDFWGELPEDFDWDVVAIRLNVEIQKAFPEAELRFDGLTRDCYKSIIFDYEDRSRLTDYDHYQFLKAVDGELMSIWESFEVHKNETNL